MPKVFHLEPAPAAEGLEPLFRFAINAKDLDVTKISYSYFLPIGAEHDFAKGQLLTQFTVHQVKWDEMERTYDTMVEIRRDRLDFDAGRNLVAIKKAMTIVYAQFQPPHEDAMDLGGGSGGLGGSGGGSGFAVPPVPTRHSDFPRGSLFDSIDDGLGHPSVTGAGDMGVFDNPQTVERITTPEDDPM